MNNYAEPTIAILHAPRGRAAVSRTAERKSPLCITAISLSVDQKRSVVIWRCAVLPNDTLYIKAVPLPLGGLLAVAVNSIHYITSGGTIAASLAVNGYAHASCTGPELLVRRVPNPAFDVKTVPSMDSKGRQHAVLEANPRPFGKLRLRLDGSHISFVDNCVAVLTTRDGDVHSLEIHGDARPVILSIAATKFRVPVPSCLAALPIFDETRLKKIAEKTAQNVNALASSSAIQLLEVGKTNVLTAGLVFCGSSLSDSSLVSYGQKVIIVGASQDSAGRGKKRKPDHADDSDSDDDTPSTPGLVPSSDTLSRLLASEEESLYADTRIPRETKKQMKLLRAQQSQQAAQTLMLQQNNDDDNDAEIAVQRKERRKVETFHTFDFEVVDTLVQTGPLGYSCEGPTTNKDLPSSQADFGKLGREKIFTAGYGKDGGLAILSCPGASSSAEIVAEVDMEGVNATYCVPSVNLLFLARQGEPCLILRKGEVLEEVDPSAIGDANLGKLLSSSSLLNVCEVATKSRATFAFLVLQTASKASLVACLCDRKTGMMSLINQHALPASSPLLSAVLTPNGVDEQLGAGFRFLDGSVHSVVATTTNSAVAFHTQDISQSDDAVTAVDVFVQSSSLFSSAESTPPSAAASSSQIDPDQANEDKLYASTEGDGTSFTSPLYEEYTATANIAAYNLSSVGVSDVAKGDARLYVATVRQSGSLEIFDAKDLETPVWATLSNAGYAPQMLKNGGKATQKSRNETTVEVQELSFFVAGANTGPQGLRSFYLLLRTSLGDLAMYAGRKVFSDGGAIAFAKCSLDVVVRSSKATDDLANSDVEMGDASSSAAYNYGRLFRFKDISGHAGVFAATSRPVWILNERGGATLLPHKARHCAGGEVYPLTAFVECSWGGSDFVTVHSRIGKQGTQRMTLFGGLGDVLEGSGYLAGGGLHIKKIPLGVTVRKITFIDEPTISTNHHPVYALIVSIDEVLDMSENDDDGMTEAERDDWKVEKCAARMETLVESDLKGHEHDFRDYVEEFRTEDFLDCKKEYGLTPHNVRTTYQVWLMDASDWSIFQKIPMGEDEVAMCVRVVKVTEDEDELAKKAREDLGDYMVPLKLFVAVGTALCGEDSENVPGKGRILLFEILKKGVGEKGGEKEEIPLLNLAYEKEIASAPVCVIENIPSGDQWLLVTGAGSEVAIEMWKDNKLVQIGFHHANMHVASMTVFKSFILLHDAYDGCQFLVWRGTDKTLTCLSKDFDRGVAFSAGVLSAGGKLAFAVCDDRQNLQFLHYAPEDEESKGGMRLVRKADMHIGCHSLDMQNHLCKSSLVSTSSNVQSSWAALRGGGKGEAVDQALGEKFGLFFGTLEGGAGAIVPVDEPVFRRLYALQNIIANGLEHSAGCNVRGWRTMKKPNWRAGGGYGVPQRNVVDGSLLYRFVNCSREVQEDLAAGVGTTVELVMDNLLEINCGAAPV